MKKLVVLLIVAAVSLNVSAEQKNKTVKADGPVVKKERKLGKIEGIKTSTGIDVLLTQGNDKYMAVEAEENLHEHIKTEVKEGVLHVYTKVNIKGSKGMKVYVTTKTINKLSASSAGDIIGETAIESDELEIKASSAGDIKLKVKANMIKASASSSGDIMLAGKANFIDASASSSGDIKAKGLTVSEAKAKASSSGDVHVTVTDKLYAKASSSGDVMYYGDPKVEKKESSGGSVIRK